MSSAPLRLVPRSAATPAPSTSVHRLGELIGAMEARGRQTTRRMARAALAEVAELVALIGLHLPSGTARRRAYERATIDPILEAIDRATGHCPRCSVRTASWAAPRGRLAFVPCASHRRRP